MIPAEQCVGWVLRMPETSATRRLREGNKNTTSKIKKNKAIDLEVLNLWLFILYIIGLRPFASAAQSDSVRRPIRFRSPSNRIPFAARPLVAYSFGTLYEAVDDNIKQNERQYIYRNNISNGHVLVKHYVQHNESQLQAENRGKSTMLG